ncbi:hypothetical protein AB6D11_02515 [Vibrio splendidus]
MDLFVVGRDSAYRYIMGLENTINSESVLFVCCMIAAVTVYILLSYQSIKNADLKVTIRRLLFVTPWETQAFKNRNWGYFTNVSVQFITIGFVYFLICSTSSPTVKVAPSNKLVHYDLGEQCPKWELLKLDMFDDREVTMRCYLDIGIVEYVLLYDGEDISVFNLWDSLGYSVSESGGRLVLRVLMPSLVEKDLSFEEIEEHLFSLLTLVHQQYQEKISLPLVEPVKWKDVDINSVPLPLLGN